jgi:RHS repeat-associated protein
LPVAVLAPAGNFYIAPDHLGSPHQITDANGAVVWLWHPDPFGNGDPIGAFAYELRFPGQYFDQATRLHYNYFRDYDPRTGRYIESDPIGLDGGINTYAYADGNPLAGTDPHGTGFVDCAKALADLAKATGQVEGRVADIIANGCKPDQGHRKASNQAVNGLKKALSKVANNCAGVAAAAAAIAAAEAAIEAAAPFLVAGAIL